MEKLYYTVTLPDSLSGARGLKRQSGRKGVSEFLSKQDAYTLHKDVKRRFPRRKTLAFGIDDLWQGDLVDLSSLLRANDGYRYLFTCIDVFSKMGRIVLVKNKMASTITEAFSSMISTHKPRYLQTDKGTEFLNTTFQRMLSDNGIKHYTSENDDIKCSVVERWHRTILAKLYRYFTYKNTTRYVEVIHDLVKSYNDTTHSTIKMAPSAVDEHNESDVRERLLSFRTPIKRPIQLKVGDTVRISGARRAFAKGYRDKWTEEIFKVVKIHDTNPITFSLTDYDGETIKGKFYAEELQRVVKDVFRIEKVLRTRHRAGKTEYLVKWLGYPDKFNSWVDDISA